jgi:SH3 domain protein
MPTMTHRLYFISLLIAILTPIALAADTAYVIDKLLVGVHQDKNLNSAIIKVLPTGTKLEVKKRDGELALIKDPNGVEGWIDAAYLMEEVPAGIAVTQLEAEVAALTSKLEAGGTSPSGKPVSSNERDQWLKENTELKRDLSAGKLKIAEFQTKVAALESKAASRVTTPADTVIEELEAANLELSRGLERSIQANQRLESELEERDDQPGLTVHAGSLSTPIVAGFGLGLLLTFGSGVYFMDYLNRRRHGGFRV